MRRPDLELGELGVHDDHHDPVGGQLPGRRSGRARIGAHLGLVGQRGLVPMMPIGDEQRLAPEIAEQPIVGLDGRQLVEQPIAVAGAPLVAPGACHDVVVALRAVEVERQDRAQLRAGAAQQREPVGLRPRHGVLVRPDPAAPRFEQHAKEHPLDGRIVRRRCRRVPVVVGGRLVSPLERAVGRPRGEGVGRRRVGVRLGAVLEAHGVAVVPRQQLRSAAPRRSRRTADTRGR